MRHFFTFILVLTFGLSAHAQIIYGSGNVTETHREYTGITSVEVRGHIIVELVRGDQEGITIITDDNLHQHLKTEFKDGNLKIWVEKNKYRKVKSRKVVIQLKELKSISNNGSGDVLSKSRFSGDVLTVSLTGSGDIDLNLSYTELTVNLNGSGEISLLGNTTKLDITQFGSGDVKAYNLQAVNVNIASTGSGNIQVFANGSLTGSTSGSGDVLYKGAASPAITSSGSGEVVKEH